MEIWDAYDRNLEKIEGMTLIRGEKIPEGVYHLVRCHRQAHGRRVSSDAA